MPSFLSSLFAKKRVKENIWDSDSESRDEWVSAASSSESNHSSLSGSDFSDTKMVNPRIPRSRIPTFTPFTSAISIALCIFFVLSLLFTSHSDSSHQYHHTVSLYFYFIFNPFLCFIFPFVVFPGEQKKKTIFLFCNFLISGFLVYWVSLIRRKNWWCGVSFGPYCVGSNGSDLILYWSSEGLICANFLGSVTRNEKCSCFLFWEST